MDLVKLHMEPHTRAKHSILTRYLGGWFPIMSTFPKILYLDGYAGSGIYDDDSPGSPLIALRMARDHFLKSQISKGEKAFYFIERDKKTYSTLSHLIHEEFGPCNSDGLCDRLPSNFKVYLQNGDFNTELNEILNHSMEKGTSIVPTLSFIDPFGYSLDLDILSKILSFKHCEVLFTFMSGFLSRFVFEEAHLQSIINTFNVDKGTIASIRSKTDESEREDEFGKLLVNIMKKNLPADEELYWLSFEMIDNYNRPLYRLIFFTKSEKGMQVMKDAMFDIGGRGIYRFSDFYFNPSQASILDYSGDSQPWVAEAAEYLHSRMAYQDWAIEDFKRYVLLKTPYIYRARILKQLEDSGQLDVISDVKRRPGNYPLGSVLRFI